MQIWVKWFHFFAIILCFALFIGCTALPNNQIIAPTSDNDQVMRDYFEKSIAAIENQDATAFQELFSKEARNKKSSELLGEIESVFEFYQGKMSAYDFNIGNTENKYSSSEIISILHGCFHITTDKKTYTAYVMLKRADSNADLTGIYQFALYEDDTIECYEYLLWESMPECGAFTIDKTMSQLNPSDYVYSILHLIESYETEKLTKTFAPKVKESVILESQAENLINWFQGGMKDCNEIKTLVYNTKGFTITEGYYEVTTYDLWKEYGDDQNKILNTYLVYFKHQRGLKDSSSDGIRTIQIVEKCDDNEDFVPIEQDGIFFDCLQQLLSISLRIFF